MDIFQSQRFRSSLKGLGDTTSRLARVMRTDARMRKNDYAEISRLNDRLKRVIPIIPAVFGISGATLGRGVDDGEFPGFFGFPGFGGPPISPPQGPGNPPKDPTDSTETDVDAEVDTDVDTDTDVGRDTSKDEDKKKDEDREKDKPGVIVPGRDEDDDKSGDVDIEDDEKIEEVPQIEVPEVIPPVVLPPKKEEEKEREPVTAFLEDVLDFITAAPTAIRIEGLKLVQRVPEIVRDVNEWVQSDEFMDMIDPPPGTPDATDKFLDSLNIPSWARGLIESLVMAIGASRGRVRPTVKPLSTPLRPVVRPPIKKIEKVKTLRGDTTTEPASKQTVDVQPLTKTVQKGNVQVGGTGSATNPIPKSYGSSFSQQKVENLQKRLEDIRVDRARRFLKDPTSDEVNIIKALEQQGITVPKFDPQKTLLNQNQASAKTLIKPIYILTDQIA